MGESWRRLLPLRQRRHSSKRCRELGAVGALLLAGCTAAQDIDQSGYPVIPITPEVVRQLNQTALRPSPLAAPAASATDYSYRISPGDVLTLRLWDGMESPGPRDISGLAPQPFTIRVEDGGTAAFPYVGTVTVNHKTIGELRTTLGQMLAKYFHAPRFDVQLQEFHGQHVLISGAVMKPGPLDLGFEPVDVAKALDKAGGAQAYADLSDVILVHRDGKREHLDLGAFLYRADASQNRILQAGDTLLFGENHRNRIFLVGDILRPGSMYIPAGHLSLTEALHQAGGPNNETASVGSIYVIRGAIAEEALSGDATAPAEPLPADTSAITIYQLDGAPISYAMADQFMLHPRDVVFISASPITEWHRFLSQLIPSTLSASKSFN